MPTLAGRGGMLYLAGAAGAAVSIVQARTWKFDIDIKTDEDNALGDTWEHFQPIIRGYTGEVTGNFDTTQTVVWSTATALAATAFYMYPQASVATSYYYGTAFFKMSLDLNLANTVRFTSGLTGQGALSAN